MLKLRDVELGPVPRVVLAVSDGRPLDELRQAFNEGVDALELRIDQFQSVAVDHVRAEIERVKDMPILATIRSAAEGGGWSDSEDARSHLFEAILPMVDAIDIELGAIEIRDQIVPIAREAGCLVLGSFHDFDATPPVERLESIHAAGRAAGVDIVKIAAHCATETDLRVLTDFTIRHAAENVVTIGMGPSGMPSRIFFPALGSLLTYTFLGQPTAPGQLNCRETLQYLKAFYPDRR